MQDPNMNIGIYEEYADEERKNKTMYDASVVSKLLFQFRLYWGVRLVYYFFFLDNDAASAYIT